MTKKTHDISRALSQTLERIKSAGAAKVALMDRMEFGLLQLCDNMAQLAEYPLDVDEVRRLHKIANAIMDLHKAVRQYCLDQDDMLYDPPKPSAKPPVIVTARNPRKIRRDGDSR